MSESQVSARQSVDPFLEAPARSPHRFTFGDHVVNVRARTLEWKGRPVAIGDRAFDLLVALLCEQGRVVSKARIMEQVWPSLFVDEGNIKTQVASLRSVLGDARHCVKCVTGRGYLFVGDCDPEG